MSKFHIGRSWGGPGYYEKNCPCEKAPCGLVSQESPDCDQHGGKYARSIRTIHTVEECPGWPTNTPTESSPTH